MNIKRVMSFADEEKETLVAAGKILGAVKKEFEDGNVDLLGEEATNLVTALSGVALDVLDKNK